MISDPTERADHYAGACRIREITTDELRALPDEDLLERARDGDTRAIEVIVARYSRLALAVAYRMCGRTWLAEDIVQEAFVSLWRSGGHYERARGSVRAWMLTVVHNQAIDAFRREAARGRLVSDLTGEPVTAADEIEQTAVRREDARRLHAALRDLPSEQRQVIELAFLAGLSHTQIATQLAIPIGTVKGRVRLGKVKLRSLLDE